MASITAGQRPPHTDDRAVPPKQVCRCLSSTAGLSNKQMVLEYELIGAKATIETETGFAGVLKQNKINSPVRYCMFVNYVNYVEAEGFVIFVVEVDATYGKYFT